MEETKKINYKSDFDFIVEVKATGPEDDKVAIDFPQYDWEIILTAGDCSYNSRTYIVSYHKGVATNCYNDNGKIHIICDNHKLPVGQLQMEFRSFLPNSNYPDGTQKVVATYELDIELTTENTGITSAEVQIVLPFLYDSAYNQAVKGGYKGTQEEYYQLASQLPNAVETANKVSKSADSLADSAEQIGGAIETLATTTDAIEQGANVIKDNADTLQASATIVKASAEQIGGSIADLKASVSSIDGAVDGINQGASTIATSATKVETSATTLEGVSTIISDSASSLSESATKVSEAANTIKESAITLENSATSIDTNTNALTSLVSDWADGKAKIAEALTRKYSPTDATESFDAMAQKVMDLPLAVEGQEGIIDHTANGIIDGYDLLNELHKHQRQDYPYCCGVEFVPSQFKTVVLSGAEAYLCSDGFFTTEQEVEHTFDEDNKLSHYIIYYYTYPTYQVPTAINPAIKLIAYNGQPRFILSNYYCPVVQSYTNERYSVGSAEIGLDAGSLVGDIMLSGIETMSGVIGANSDNTELHSISFPHLKNLESGGFIANHLTRLYNLSIPNLEVSSGTVALRCYILTKLELPSLNEAKGGTIVESCKKLKSISLPNLVKSSGSILIDCPALESLSIPNLTELNSGAIILNSTNIEGLILPKLEKQTSGQILGYQGYCKVVRLPKLVSASNSAYVNPLFASCGKSKLSIDIYMPVITDYIPMSNISDQVNFHLGTQQGCDIVFVTYSSITGVKIVTIEQGFRSSLNVSKLTSLTVESLQGIIDNLADNNDYEPLTLTLGTTLKNKLSEEYIAIATAKNYNIA